MLKKSGINAAVREKTTTRGKPDKGNSSRLVFHAPSCYQSSFANADCSDIQFGILLARGIMLKASEH